MYMYELIVCFNGRKSISVFVCLCVSCDLGALVIEEEVLHNDDVVTLGPSSFRVPKTDTVRSKDLGKN